ncbi:hypothetical protein OSB04_022084 [Centaurea solstitialis]|uniref:Uncharacterized protein n=1 Tax=Centaurea solstitialis TaxID=347529 RepID=A0AA38T8V6_9ASTR|nr:hypothetical protein OSB04_022084 [Centaurea solstitialis]
MDERISQVSCSAYPLSWYGPSVWYSAKQRKTMTTIFMAEAICFHGRFPLKLSQPQRMKTLIILSKKVLQRFRNGVRCSNSNDTPQLLKIVVSGATEILRLFSSFNKNQLYEVVPEQNYETSASCLDDIMMILKSDYDNAYFVTGNFTSGIYAEDCIFEDPTIRFRGTELYSRNLKLLVPFFELPSISLQSIEKVLNDERESIMASWRLRCLATRNSFSHFEMNISLPFSSLLGCIWTYLKLPWKPLISIDGTTVYALDKQFRIVKHVESWSVSPLEAIGQIFTPSSGSPI